MKTLSAVVILAVLAAASAAAQNAGPVDPRAVIAAKFPGMTPEQVRPSPIAGIFEVQLGPDTGYITADGKYLVAGALFDVDTRTNLTEVGRSASRSKRLAKLDERDMIVFEPAAAAKHTITVFTDVECGYCRKFHSEIDELTKLGVRVRYLAYPRTGPGTEDWRKMETVWCAKDPKTAITKAKQGEPVDGDACAAAPVTKQYQLGQELGVRGTPAIYSATGEHLGGYLPPQQLVQHLDELQSAAKKN